MEEKKEEKKEKIIVEDTKKEEQVQNTIKTTKQTSPPITIAGFVCGICGLVTCGISSIAGLILCLIGFDKSKKNGYRDDLAIAGIVVSSVLILIIGVPFTNGFIEGFKSGISNQTKEEKEPVVNKKKYKVINFSEMSKEEIKSWCEEAKINCYFKNEYSDTVEVNGFISQSIKEDDLIEENGKITISYSLGVEPTVSQKNAVRKAESYIRYMAFSREGLIEQLEYEKYSNEDAVYAVDHITVDWNEQAAKKAKSYLEYMGFSREGLIDQLLYEGFTYDQAVYGVEQNGL